MRRTKAWLPIATVLLLSLAASACGDDDDAAAVGTSTTASVASDAEDGAEDPLAPRPLAERTKVTISPIVAVEPFAAVYLADHFGEFEKENLEVEISELGATDAYLLMSRGDVDLQIAGVNAGMMNLVSSGVDLRFIANAHQASGLGDDGLWVRNENFEDGDIVPSTLDGMKIALGSGGYASTAVLPVDEWLDANGGDLGDINPVAITGSDMLVAIEQGAVDAAYATAPISIQVRESGCCTLVTPQPPFAASAYAMTETFIEEEPDVARAIVRAIARTVRDHLQGDYHADEEVSTALSEILGIPVEALRSQEPLVFDPDLGLDLDALESLQRIWIDLDAVEYDEALDLSDLSNTSIVRSVLGG